MEGKTQGRIVRRLRIGPRLSLAIAIPSVALLCLLVLLTASDLALLRDLRSYTEHTDNIAAQIEVRSALQVERSTSAGLDSTTTSLAEQVAIDEALTSLGFVGGSNFLEDLEVARQFASNNRGAEATLIYNELVHGLQEDIATNLDSAPLGIADQRSRALNALLNAQEFLLLEDLEALDEQLDSIELNEFHTAALSEMGRFANEGSPEGSAMLEQITISDSWRELNLLRLSALEQGGDGGLDPSVWELEANSRSDALAALVELETDTLRRDLDATVEDEFGRFGLLAGVMFVILTIVTMVATALRHSIIAPIEALTLSARKIAEGEPAPTNDASPDEIGEMARAFASISGTIEHIWTDVDTVAGAVAEGDYEQRIDTTDLPGDWLHLAETVNLTLDTGEEHHLSVNEELHHRDALAQISSAATLAENGKELTTAVLKYLPLALPGSTSHLHRHPSGPPLLDLGTLLEAPISALEMPSAPEHGEVVDLRGDAGIATLVEFAEGPPALLLLRFGSKTPTRIDGLISVVETAAQILAQGHRRHVAETRALFDREHDQLTELPNSDYARHWFGELTDRSIPWSIVGVEPQQLDMVDGSMGRDSRDDLMRAIARALSDIVGDLSETHNFEAVLARFARPDFGVIVPTLHRERLSEMIANRFRKPIVIDGSEIEIGATIAYSEVAPDDVDLTQTISNVSASISQADGRDIEIIPFQETHREELRRRSVIVDWLSRAIANQDLSVHFQPIVQAVTTQTEGYEALVRASMEGNPLSPAEFIPIAEETGMISAIDEFVLRQACAALPLLKGDEPYVAVNLSPVELLDDDLIERIEEILDSSNTPRDRLVFEVTEGATATSEALGRLWELRELGVKIAIDDFGTGQSNLSYLNDLPAQILKLDRSLVTPITEDDNAATLLEKTIEMAHALDMTVVGEGVETAEELNALRRIYCDRVQGWHTGRPGPLEQFTDISIDDVRSTVDTEAEAHDEAA